MKVLLSALVALLAVPGPAAPGADAPEEDIAFNLGLVRGSLSALETSALLVDPVRGSLAAGFESEDLEGRGLVLPVEWTRQPASRAGCTRVPRADGGVAASPPGDFTVTFRALLWTDGGVDPAAAAEACGRPEGTPEMAYARRYRKLGVDTGSWGAFRRDGGDVVLLEVEAPQSKLPHVQGLFVEWLQRVAE